MTEREPAVTRIELSPELREQFGFLIATVRMLSHGALSSSDVGPMQPMGLEALTMAVDRHAEAVQSGMHEVAEAMSDMAQALRGEEPYWLQGRRSSSLGDHVLGLGLGVDDVEPDAGGDGGQGVDR